MPYRNVSIVLWSAQVFLTLFPAWFLYMQHQQAKLSGYRERSALFFSAALFTWTIAGVLHLLATVGFIFENSGPTSKREAVQTLLSTINTLFLTVGVVRLDNFPKPLGHQLSRLSNRFWIVLTAVLVAVELFIAMTGPGPQILPTIDMIIGFVAIVPIVIGMRATFLKYEMGKLLTTGIIVAVLALEGVLVYRAWSPSITSEGLLFTNTLMITTKVMFMIVLVMLTGAWGRYYISGTIEELKEGGLPQRVRPLLEVIPGNDIEIAQRKAYRTILSYWPDSPVLLEAIKTEGPSSRQVIAATRNPQMIADMIGSGILNLGLSHVAEKIAADLIDASSRAEEHPNGQKRKVAR